MVDNRFVLSSGAESRAWIRETSLFWACSGRFFAFGVWNPCLAGCELSALRRFLFGDSCTVQRCRAELLNLVRISLFFGVRVENGRVLVRLVVGVVASGLYSVLHRKALFGVAFWLILERNAPAGLL